MQSSLGIGCCCIGRNTGSLGVAVCLVYVYTYIRLSIDCAYARGVDLLLSDPVPS